MTRNQFFLLATASCGVVIAGCNIGMQPTGASVSDIQKIRETWPPEKQIEDVKHSPMPPAAKAQRIAEIKAKYHITTEDPKPEVDPRKPPGY